MNPKEKDNEIIELTDEELDEIFADDDFDNGEEDGDVYKRQAPDGHPPDTLPGTATAPAGSEWPCPTQISARFSPASHLPMTTTRLKPVSYTHLLDRILVTALRSRVSSQLTITGSSGKSGTIAMPPAAAGSTARMLSYSSSRISISEKASSCRPISIFEMSKMCIRDSLSAAGGCVRNDAGVGYRVRL